MNDDSKISGHELIEPPVARITLSLGALLITIALVLVVVAGVFAAFSSIYRQPPPLETATLPPLPKPVPQLDPHEADELEQLRSREQHLLSEYRWIDQKAGVARIPINRAMAILAEQSPPTSALNPAEAKHD